MTRETTFLIDIWDSVRDFIPANKRADAAIGVVRSMAEYGIEASDLAAIEDEDRDLFEAYKEVFEIEDQEDEDEDY